MATVSFHHPWHLEDTDASRSPLVNLWHSVYMCMLHHVHENALLLLITCDVCMCVCYLYCGYKNPCVVTLWIFLTHIWTQWQNLVSWVCKANVAHRLTLMKNDTIRSLYSRCTIKHSCKGEALDKCMSVSPLRGCRMRAMTLQYNLRLSAEEPMKKLLLCCSFFFFPPPRRVVSLLTR